MQIKISARHGTLGPDTQAFIREKADKLVHFFNRVTQIEVTVDLKNEGSYLVEIKVDAEHKHDFFASDKSDDVLAAFDGTVEKLKQQLKKYKQKVQDHRRRPATGDVAGAPALEDSDE